MILPFNVREECPLPPQEDVVGSAVSKASSSHPQVLHQPQVLHLMSHNLLHEHTCHTNTATRTHLSHKPSYENRSVTQTLLLEDSCHRDTDNTMDLSQKHRYYNTSVTQRQLLQHTCHTDTGTTTHLSYRHNY